MEVWKRIPNSFLMASSLGRIKSEPYERSMPNGGIRTYQLSPTYGYWVKDRKRYIIRWQGKTYRIARIVCEAFHGPPKEGEVVMHLDENSQNNRPENLKWGSQKENLNFPGFLEYCKSRTGANSPVSKGIRNKENTYVY